MNLDLWRGLCIYVNEEVAWVEQVESLQNIFVVLPYTFCWEGLHYLYLLVHSDLVLLGTILNKHI